MFINEEGTLKVVQRYDLRYVKVKVWTTPGCNITSLFLRGLVMCLRLPGDPTFTLTAYTATSCKIWAIKDVIRTMFTSFLVQFPGNETRLRSECFHPPLSCKRCKWSVVVTSIQGRPATDAAEGRRVSPCGQTAELQLLVRRRPGQVYQCLEVLLHYHRRLDSNQVTYRWALTVV